jgi:hypothetical protein
MTQRRKVDDGFSGYPEMKMAFTPPLAAISSRARAQPYAVG